MTLYGLEIVKDRDVAYGPKNPDEAHKVFVARALVEGRVKDPPEFLRHNLALQDKIAAIEEKLRRRNIMVDERTIADFYSRRLAGVFDLRDLEKRIQKMRGDGFLRMSEKDLLLTPPDSAELALYPDSIVVGDKRFRSAYKFAPGAEEDGLTVRIPSPDFAAIPDTAFEWGPPGYFRDKVEALLKGLPKAYRKQLQPIANTVDIITRGMRPAGLSLFESLAAFVRGRFGLDIPAREWAAVDLPPYLRTRIALTDHAGKETAAGRDPAAIRRAAVPSAMPENSAEWQAARRQWERTGIAAWDFDELPETVQVGHFLVGYLGLEPAEKGVSIRLFRDKEAARTSHERGVEALLAAKFARDTDFLRRYLLVPEEHAKAALYFGGKPALEKKMQEKLRAELFRRNIRTRRDYEAHAATLNRAMAEAGHRLQETTMGLLDAYRQTRDALQSVKKPAASKRALGALVEEARLELDRLVPANFMDLYPLETLKELPRYVSSLWVRVQRGKNDPEKDKKKAEEVQPFAQALAKLEKETAKAAPDFRRAVEEFRGMLEEFRVAVFAPELKTAYPVSAKRLAAKIREINNSAPGRHPT